MAHVCALYSSLHAEGHPTEVVLTHCGPLAPCDVNTIAFSVS
jgi:hypothetical protein